MNAVEVIEITGTIVWFTWAFGQRIGCCTRDRGVELNLEGRPTMSFRYAIRDAYIRFKT